jgi:hypothetical protein
MNKGMRSAAMATASAGAMAAVMAAAPVEAAEASVRYSAFVIPPLRMVVLAVVQPGAGLDLASHKPLGVRLQADWPLVTTAGAAGGIPRLSAGIVWRPDIHP